MAWCEGSMTWTIGADGEALYMANNKDKGAYLLAVATQRWSKGNRIISYVSPGDNPMSVKRQFTESVEEARKFKTADEARAHRAALGFPEKYTVMMECML